MLDKSINDVFIFEFASCFGLKEEIAVEGYAMYCTLIRDAYESNMCKPISFLTCPQSFNTLSPKSYFRVNDWIDCLEIRDAKSDKSAKGVKDKTNCANNVYANGIDSINLSEFEYYSEKAEYTLLVAPEDNGLLLELTKHIKSKNLCSNEKAVKVCSDKWKIYKKLKNKVDMPRTSLNPDFENFVLKPRTSCGGCGIYRGDINIEMIPDGYIAQEYVSGIPLSVSVIAGDDIIPISVNKQLIRNFKYVGSITPADSLVSRDSYNFLNSVVDSVIEAVSTLRLSGYCGVDVILGDKPYIVDVNARITTSAVLFKWVYDINIVDVLIENYDKGKIRYDKLHYKLDCFSKFNKKVKRAKLIKENGKINIMGI